jgi:peptidyl-prolyl cis-trans isomerase B (cyclophilin B)
VPSEKRARQRSAREARLAAEARARKRRGQIRNIVIVVIVAGVIVGIAFAVSSGGGNKPKTAASATTTTAKGTASTTTTTAANSKADAKAQAAANKLAVDAGCPSNPSTRVNTQTYSAAPAMTIDPSKLYSATVKTTLGSFTISLYAKSAPNTVNNFVFLADKGYYNCNTFLRVIPGFVDQTGDPTGLGTGGPGYKFANENVPTSYATGEVAMANSGGSDSNGSQFYLVAPGGATTLDSDLSQGDAYSLFGTVASGMSVVDAINKDGSTAGTPPDVTQRVLSVTIHEATSAY